VTDQKKAISDVVTLEEPIVRGEGDKAQTIETLQLRRPNSGELRGLNLHDVLKLDVDTLHELLPRITVPPITKAEAQRLDPADLVSVSAEVAGFFVPRGMMPAYPAQ
jgi:hypothetical protein